MVMSYDARTLLEHYLNITYASHDTAMMIREAKNTLCLLTGAQQVQIYLFRADNVLLISEQPDGTYRLEHALQKPETIKGEPNVLFLYARTEVQEYGAVLLKGDRVRPSQYAQRLVHVLGEQLHTGLLSNELDMMVNGRKRLVPEDGSLPSETLAVLAHEMRAPVATALASLEVIRHRLNHQSHDESFFVLCDALERNLRRSMRMSTNLLLASKSRYSAPSLEWLNVVELWCETAASVRPYAAQRGVELQVESKAFEKAPYALSNQQYLESIMINLLSNAVRYAKPEGGLVRVDIVQKEEGLFLTVADNGKGFPSEKACRLFEKFWRGEQSDAVRGGAGLGLYLVWVFVKALGGTVEAENQNGAVFRVYLPLKTKQQGHQRALGAGRRLEDNYWNSAQNEFSTQG